MEQAFLNTPVAPGEMLTHEIDGEVVGWLIGDMDGSKVWIGQMVSADLALAGIDGDLAEEAIIWVAAIRDGKPTVRHMVRDYDAARELAIGTASIIRLQIAGQMQ